MSVRRGKGLIDGVLIKRSELASKIKVHYSSHFKQMTLL